jgi:uncharacterized protein YbcV (DUF1398 family)
MNPQLQLIASSCIAAAASGEKTFPQLLDLLRGAGFEGYQVDLRAGTASYYLPSGEAVTLRAEAPPAAAPGFDAAAVTLAIREAQQGGPGYTYPRFCEKIAQAGCVGYLVSIPGARVVYFGRTGETHTENFPGST